ERPNGLGMSRAAPIKQEGSQAESYFQNRDDLARRSAVSAPAPCWAARLVEYLWAIGILWQLARHSKVLGSFCLIPDCLIRFTTINIGLSEFRIKTNSNTKTVDGLLVLTGCQTGIGSTPMKCRVISFD